MRLLSILIALSTWLHVGAVAYNARPRNAVGISLSSGYATVSALLPNGTYTDIAKVEGDATYKACMFGLQGKPTEIFAPIYCPFSSRICQHWPFTSIQTQNPLAPILKALVASAESALDTSINSVAVSAYDLGNIDYDSAKDDVHTSLNELGFDSHLRLDHVVRQLAPALGIGGNCSEPYTLPEDPDYHHDQAQSVFHIEYTRDSMTAGLWTEECGTMEMVNRWNSVELGHNAMQICRETANNKMTCEETFKSALHSVSEYPSRDRHAQIGPVLVFGECADDEAMLNSLRQVLAEQFSNGDSVDLSQVQSFSPDPAFAGARSMGAVWTAHGSNHEGHYAEEL